MALKLITMVSLLHIGIAIIFVKRMMSLKAWILVVISGLMHHAVRSALLCWSGAPWVKRSCGAYMRGASKPQLKRDSFEILPLSLTGSYKTLFLSRQSYSRHLLLPSIWLASETEIVSSSMHIHRHMHTLLY